jgi:hypothetical protein
MRLDDLAHALCLQMPSPESPCQRPYLLGGVRVWLRSLVTGSNVVYGLTTAT